jgi:hypothetical protein
MVFALAGLGWSWFGGFAFMVLMGLGLYLPYVAIHTTVFERMIAMTREPANLGFLMYLADAVGYLGYAAVMIAESFLPQHGNFLRFYTVVSWLIAIFTLISLALSWVYFTRQGRSDLPCGAAS